MQSSAFLRFACQQTERAGLAVEIPKSAFSNQPNRAETTAEGVTTRGRLKARLDFYSGRTQSLVPIVIREQAGGCRAHGMFRV